MTLEGRTITTLAELRDFTEAAIRAAKVPAETVRVGPLDMQLCETRLPNGRLLHDIITRT